MLKPNDFSRILQVSMMVALHFALASCAPDENDEIDTTVDSVPAAVEPSTPEPVTFDLESVDSEVDGEATVSRVGESLMVSLTLDKLAGEGPFAAQVVSGRCEDRDDTAARTTTPATPGATPPATTPQPPATEAGMQGQVLATLEPIQLSPATPAQPGGVAAQSGMSHSTIPVTSFHAMPDAFIQVQGQASRVIACGNIDNLDGLLSGTAGTTTAPVTPAPGTPAPGTAPATPPRP
jgi:hypothetical protein